MVSESWMRFRMANTSHLVGSSVFHRTKIKSRQLDVKWDTSAKSANSVTASTPSGIDVCSMAHLRCAFFKLLGVCCVYVVIMMHVCYGSIPHLKP